MSALLVPFANNSQALPNQLMRNVIKDRKRNALKVGFLRILSLPELNLSNRMEIDLKLAICLPTMVSLA